MPKYNWKRYKKTNDYYNDPKYIMDCDKIVIEESSRYEISVNNYNVGMSEDWHIMVNGKPIISKIGPGNMYTVNYLSSGDVLYIKSGTPWMQVQVNLAYDSQAFSPIEIITRLLPTYVTPGSFQTVRRSHVVRTRNV